MTKLRLYLIVSFAFFLFYGCGPSPSALVDKLELVVNQGSVKSVSDAQMLQIVGRYNGLVMGINKNSKRIPLTKLMDAQNLCDRFQEIINSRDLSVRLVQLQINTQASASSESKVSRPSRTKVNSGESNQRKTSDVSHERVMTGEEIFSKYNSAVFMIFNSNEISGCQGSGFFISPDGLAVSNYHVFKGLTKGAEIIKLNDGSTYKIKEVLGHGDMCGNGPDYNDFFVFVVDLKGARVNSIPIAKSLAHVGQKAYAIGSPLGLENTFSSGEISQIRDIDGHKIYQISVPIDHGSSGGVLLNQYGEAIGITSAGMESSANLNFAIDIHETDYLIN